MVLGERQVEVFRAGANALMTGNYAMRALEILEYMYPAKAGRKDVATYLDAIALYQSSKNFHWCLFISNLDMHVVIPDPPRDAF